MKQQTELETPFSIDWRRMLKQHDYTVTSAARELGLSVNALTRQIDGTALLDLDIAIHLLRMCGHTLYTDGPDYKYVSRRRK